MAALRYYDIIFKPVVTEISMSIMADNKYTFLVNPKANKTQIKEAVEKLFPGTKVEKVNTMVKPGKHKRRRLIIGTTNKTKKAIVTLTKDSKSIDLYPGL